MLKKQKFQGEHFVPEVLSRHEIGLPSTGAKTNELIAKHVHMRGFVLVYTCICVILVTTGQYKNMDCSREAAFSLQFPFYT